jgi:hypothetical protein
MSGVYIEARDRCCACVVEMRGGREITEIAGVVGVGKTGGVVG